MKETDPQLPENLKRFLQKEEEQVTKLSRQQFWNECEENLQRFNQMEVQAGLGRMGLINLMNRARRFEIDPDFRLKYKRVRKGGMDVLQIETIPKEVGFKLKKNE